MSMWDFVSSATEKVKPHLTAVRSICNIASNTIDSAVRVNAVEKLNVYWSDEQARSDITRLATTFAKNTGAYAIEEGVKLVPGGAPMHRIISKSLTNGGAKKSDNNKFVDKDEKIKELEARIAKLEKQGCRCTSKL